MFFISLLCFSSLTVHMHLLCRETLLWGLTVTAKASTSLVVCVLAVLQVIGPVLRIINALVRDRGVYICTAENAGGSSVTSAVVEVERKWLLLFIPLLVQLDVQLCLLHSLPRHIIYSYRNL
jgi:hypothetical protein